MPIAVDHPPPLWRSPVAGAAIVRPYREVAPFAAGGHRGIDLRARPGRAVVAPCSGRLTFRGAVAGGPPTVTIDCGHLRATLQRVISPAEVGSVVRRGSRLGIASSAAVDLSARRPDGTYRDPTTLIGTAGRTPVPAPPVPRSHRQSRPPLTSRDAHRPARIADRALVTAGQSFSAPDGHIGPGERTDPVDVPLGVAGGGLMALVAVGWAVALVRRRTRVPEAARGASLARAQR